MPGPVTQDARGLACPAESFSIDNGTSSSDYLYQSRIRLTSEPQSISGQSTRIVSFNDDAMGNSTSAIIASPAITATLTRRLTWGQDHAGSPSLQGAGGVGGLLMVEEITSTTNEAYHFHYDGNGNVTEITDHLGASVATYRYDAFGNTLVANGSYAATNRYRFSTKPLDHEVTIAPLYYYGYRYLDPLTGRWPSRDPIEERGGVNLYGFVGNDGVNRVDLLGKIQTKVWTNGLISGGIGPDLKDYGTFEWGCVDEKPVFGKLGYKVELEHGWIDNVTFVGGFGASGSAEAVEQPLDCPEGETGSRKRVVITWHANLENKIGFGIGWLGIEGSIPVLVGVGNVGYEINCCCKKEKLIPLTRDEEWEVIDYWRDNREPTPPDPNADPNGFWPDWLPPQWTPQL